MTNYGMNRAENDRVMGNDAPTASRPVEKPKEAVKHPDHYGGGNNPYEVIKVIRAWDLGFDLGNAVKYIARAGKKDPSKHVEDLEKAVFYLQDEIKHLKDKGLPF